MKHHFEITRHPTYRAPGVRSGTMVNAKCVMCEKEYEVTSLHDEPWDSGLYAECREAPDEQADAFDDISKKMEAILNTD